MNVNVIRERERLFECDEVSVALHCESCGCTEPWALELFDKAYLTDDPGHVEGKVNGVMLVLKTEFLKKA